jgi:hypothetical protein
LLSPILFHFNKKSKARAFPRVVFRRGWARRMNCGF